MPNLGVLRYYFVDDDFTKLPTLKCDLIVWDHLLDVTSYWLLCFCHVSIIHSCRHIGHNWFVIMWGWLSHFSMQWMWKQWLQRPETRGQSSPGALQSAQQSSKEFLQIPQSSCFAVHFQAATPRKLLIFISMFERMLEHNRFWAQKPNMRYSAKSKHKQCKFDTLHTFAVDAATSTTRLQQPYSVRELLSSHSSLYASLRLSRLIGRYIWPSSGPLIRSVQEVCCPYKWMFPGNLPMNMRLIVVHNALT